jgi:hypothetical protein
MVSFTGKDNLQKYVRDMKYSYYTLCPIYRVLIRVKNIGVCEKEIMRYRLVIRVIETAVYACFG